jgi:hypothetical protein
VETIYQVCDVGKMNIHFGIGRERKGEGEK